MASRTVRIAMAVCCVVAAGGSESQLAAKLLEREVHEVFEVRPGMRLRLEHGDGDVTVTPWDQDSLDITVRYRAEGTASGWWKERDFEVEFREEGNTIHVIGKEPQRIGFGISSVREYEHSYTVRAPSYLDLALEGEDGDVKIEDWRGAMEVRLEDGNVRLASIEASRSEVILEDGDLRIDGLRGELVIEAEDGDVEISDLWSELGRISVEDGDLTMDGGGGNLRVLAADGDLRLLRFAARELEIRVDDGSVDLGLLPSNGLDLDVRARDGDVEASLDSAISATFTLETRDGRVRVDAPKTSDLQKERRRITGRLGDGRGRIFISSVDGSVTLRQ